MGNGRFDGRLYVTEIVGHKHERGLSKMNKMKKVLVLVLVAAIVSLGLSLTGCKKKTETTPPDPASKEVAPDEHPAGEEHPDKE